jgi:hypothetical protein
MVGCCMETSQFAKRPKIQYARLIKFTVSMIDPFFKTSRTYSVDEVSGKLDQGGSSYGGVFAASTGLGSGGASDCTTTTTSNTAKMNDVGPTRRLFFRTFCLLRFGGRGHGFKPFRKFTDFSNQHRLLEGYFRRILLLFGFCGHRLQINQIIHSNKK